MDICFGRSPLRSLFIKKKKKEKDLLEETSKKNVKDKLLKHEGLALNEWRKNDLFNKNSNLVMRLQDKGSRFVVVDK